ncbi:hypothetical protein LTR91_021868 [Friedmanniomyces endolithicus]|uniref:Uncharacterized protein n=1 Tax=Friedmanniomyces endolithicus TaxID=329885 RepID=A0AAN6JZX1_9PEZI|nr:hypothetical protein LTR94_018590 [Friedmanniomyces endolithicus]KAK0772920.1 hypothetical protein LTR59_015475 [Friedmanniomyces endolithicus]KAK0776385.1 hypothetical protein LTR75_016280 [Friedmanniomyces endolithicus]KAK0776880.1 hypothetical protein LTR38_015358 [Friedmanniomyces endolithicus]KAK0831892.1 hypothetical protein LTR03_015358 [Friedmanniomyces endolithicus]
MSFRALIAMVAYVLAFAAMITTTLAAPVIGASYAIRQAPSFTPFSGGNTGHFWHVEDFTIKWPTHSLTITSNFTEDMPHWQPEWAPNQHFDAITTEIHDADHPTPQVGTGINGHVINSCPYTIHVQTAIGNNPGYTNNEPVTDPADGSTYTIAPGAWYTTQIQAAVNGGGGVSIKLSKDAVLNPTNTYQVEYSQAANKDGRMAIWYDISRLNGDPFLNEKRYMQVDWDASVCPNLYSGPGSTGADWSAGDTNTQKECEEVGDVYFYLC